MSPTAAEEREYDRFGPWIDEVKVPDDVPKLFRSHPLDLSTTRMVLKVPRNLARRDAWAGMDLYDHLVILGNDEITVLSRRRASGARGLAAAKAGAFDAVSIRLADIVAIRDDLNLLDGRLTVSSSAGVSITFRYNGSTHEKVTRLVDELRAGAGAAPASSVGSALMAAGNGGADGTAVPDPGIADTYLVSHFLELRAVNPTLAVWASHGRRRLTTHQDGLRGLIARAANVVSPMTLHGAVFAADGKAMEILGRHQWLVRGRAAIYSTSRLVIPLGAPDGLEVSAHRVYPNVTVATIRAGKWSTKIAVPGDSVAERLLRTASQSIRH